MWGRTRGTAVAIVGASVLASINPVAVNAATFTAGDLVKDCIDGLVTVVGREVYRGGDAILDNTCIIRTTTGSTFVLDGVRITGAGDLATTTPTAGAADVTVAVRDSVIELAGVVELKAGGAAGDPGVPEENGQVVVQNSRIAGSTLILLASFDWPNGSILLRDAELDASSGSIDVRASDLLGSDGVVKIVGSTVKAPFGDIRISTGTDAPSGDAGRVKVLDSFVEAGGAVDVNSGVNGRTSVRNSTVIGSPVTITTGPGGTCRIVGVVPPVACT